MRRCTSLVKGLNEGALQRVTKDREDGYRSELNPNGHSHSPSSFSLNLFFVKIFYCMIFNGTAKKVHAIYESSSRVGTTSPREDHVIMHACESPHLRI